MAINLLIVIIFIIVIGRSFTVNIKLNLARLLFTYIFIIGLLELSGLPDLIIKSLIDLLLLFTLFYLLQTRSIKIPGLNLFLLFSFGLIFSILINNSDIYHSLTFFRIYLYAYIIFLYFYNLRLSDKAWLDFNKLLVWLFILQILASIYKFSFIGITEKQLIGTINTSGGNYSTTLPLFAISFLISFYLFIKRKTKYLLLILGFLFMGFVGGKRGIWFYTPILLLISYYIYIKISNKNIASRRNASIFFLLSIFAVGLFVFAGKYNRSLNPENKFGGVFDPEYITEYAVEYTFSGRNGNEANTGRGTNFILTIDHLLHAPLPNLLFGFGPDALKGSSTYGEGIWGEFGVNGPVTGLTANLIQIGLFGSTIIIIVFFLLFKAFYKIAQLERTPYWKAIATGGAIASIMILIDYFTYSGSFLNTIFALSFSLFYVLGMLESRKRFRNVGYLTTNLVTA